MKSNSEYNIIRTFRLSVVDVEDFNNSTMPKAAVPKATATAAEEPPSKPPPRKRDRRNRYRNASPSTLSVRKQPYCLYTHSTSLNTIFSTAPARTESRLPTDISGEEGSAHQGTRISITGSGEERSAHQGARVSIKRSREEVRVPGQRLCGATPGAHEDEACGSSQYFRSSWRCC